MNEFIFFSHPLSAKYAHFPEKLRLQMREEALKMFYTGYDCYMNCAFPMDELDPIKYT